MVSKLPDEFFRRRPDPAIADGVAPVGNHGARDGEPQAGEPRPRQLVMVPTRIAAVLVFLALLAGFLVGRWLLGAPDVTAQPIPRVEPTATAATSSPTSNPPVSLHQGPTVSVRPIAVDSSCGQDSIRVSEADLASWWVCSGSGVGERLRFSFQPGQELVGIRLVGGNSSDFEAFMAERRIVAIRWRFSDGSWFEQGLSSENPGSQEIGFPLLHSDYVELEILASTPPGRIDGEVTDLVSISQLQFLAPL